MKMIHKIIEGDYLRKIKVVLPFAMALYVGPCMDISYIVGASVGDVCMSIPCITVY